MSERTQRAWPLYILAAAAVGAIGVGIYMTQHHEIGLYGSADMQGELIGCVESEKVSCDVVNTSEWSEFLGVPQFTWAIPMYALLAGLSLLAARGKSQYKPVILALGVFNALYSILLGYISVVQLGKICTWCLRLYVLNFATPVLAWASGLSKDDISVPAFVKSGAAFAAIALLAVGGQRTYRAQLLAMDGSAPEIAALPSTSEVLSEPKSYKKDPTGPAPSFEFTIKTEDGNEAVLKTDPNDAWKGAPDATVAIIEYADFECGYCKRASSQLKRLFEAYQDDIAIIYKHFPMNPECNPGVKNPKHRKACQLHEASLCAKDQGYFWAFHDLLYKNQHAVLVEHQLQYVREIGMDENEFIACMRSGRHKQDVVASGQTGADLDIHGTPRIFIQGKLYRAGSSAESMARAIESALGRDTKEAQKNAQAMRQQRRAVKAIPADVPEMQLVEIDGHRFYIDTFESSLQDGKAVSAKHEIPATRMSWFAARDACEAAGKRVCSEPEWIAACQNAWPSDDDNDGHVTDDMIEGNAYPYGEFHERGTCWDGHTRGDKRPVYTGEMPGCVSPTGVYDLTGNVEEWVGTSPENAVLLGGAWDTPNDKARCYRPNDTFGAGYANVRTGFRCCKNAD